MLGHAEAGGDANGRRTWEARLGKLGPDAVRELRRADRVGARQQKQELLAAPAAGEVGVAERRAKDVRELAQHVVADRVPVRVVHVLEVVEVDEHDSQRRAETVGPGDLRGAARPRTRGGSRGR